MTTAPQLSGAAPGTPTRARPRAALPAPCGTQITGWGILYFLGGYTQLVTTLAAISGLAALSVASAQ